MNDNAVGSIGIDREKVPRVGNNDAIIWSAKGDLFSVGTTIGGVVIFHTTTSRADTISVMGAGTFVGTQLKLVELKLKISAIGKSEEPEIPLLSITVEQYHLPSSEL